MTDTLTFPLDKFSHNPPVAVPCPDWCQEVEGHGYEVEHEEGWAQRHHSITFGTADTEANVASLATWRMGVEEVPTPDIVLWLDGDAAGPVMTAERAREVASVLLEAAAWLEAHS